jgi:WD40 repeat protein
LNNRAWLFVAGASLLQASPLFAQGPKLQATFKSPNPSVQAVAYSPDGKTLASGIGIGNRTIRLWDATKGKELATIKARTGRVTSLAFSQDSRTLASGCEENTIKFWDLAAGK